MLEIALDCIRRGWATFPCSPRTKKPRIPVEEGGHGFYDATLDEAQVREWWSRPGFENCNVPVATGASKLFVLDIDAGLADEAALVAWMEKHNMPKTFAVRSGSRPAFKVHLYYSQPEADLKSVNGWELDGCSGDIRCSTGLVIAPGGQHKSGTPYAVLWDLPLKPTPESAKALTEKSNAGTPTEVDAETAEGWKDWLWKYIDRNDLEPTGFEAPMTDGWKIGIVCPWEKMHTTEQGNSSTVLCIRDGNIVFTCSHGSCGRAGHNTAAFKQLMKALHDEAEPEPGAMPDISIGTGLPMPKAGGSELDPEDPESWRKLFHTKGEILLCPEPTFFIRDFLQHQAICAIAAPVGQRKSLIALNTVHALSTGAPLFGFLPVESKPDRIFYFCPEMGLISVSKRVRNSGLTDFVQDTLFLHSMNGPNLDIKDVLNLPERVLTNSIVVLDTAIRFMEGDEQSSKDMKIFSSGLFALQKRQGMHGAIMVLYHSPKATAGAFELTLENCLRGSGELGAAVTDGHGTRLQPIEDDQDDWDALSFIRHVKVRDYNGQKDFEVKCDKATGLMSRVGDGSVKAVLSSKKTGPKVNPDGMDDAARAFVKAHADWTVPRIQAEFKEMGWSKGRGKTWITEVRLEARGCGSKLTSEPA